MQLIYKKKMTSLPLRGQTQLSSYQNTHAVHETQTTWPTSRWRRNVPNAVQTDDTALHEIDQTPGRGHEQLAPALNLANLVTDRCATVAHGRVNHAAVAQLACLAKNLRRELSRRRDDECWWELLAVAVATLGERRGAVDHHALKHRDQERCCLARARLCTCHQIAASRTDWHSILLHGGELLVPAAQAYVYVCACVSVCVRVCVCVCVCVAFSS